ncbi:MAG: hypothetical protein A3H31_01620 [Gallionellales bacterium RIFCSPLOWO2_02_FULL_57_47]|nr:MAG: hypothetical protein A3H31_01620 [Gallionellales bacterium RIFCSPLOWO2_02_FULL_57_47]
MFSLFGAFLAASIGPIVTRVLLALGLGTVTYVGLQAAFDSARNLVISNYGQMHGAAMQLADLAGVGQTIGILLGAMAARIGMVALSKIGRVL